MTPESFASQITENAADVDEIAEAQANAVRARVAVLLEQPEERDADLWEDAADELGIDSEWLAYSLSELTEFDKPERGISWQAAVGTIIAVSQQQAFLELVARPLIEVSENHAAGLAEAPASVVRVVAEKGITKAEFDGAKQRRKDNVSSLRTNA